MKKGGILASPPFIAIEPNDPRTMEIETLDLALVDSYQVEIRAFLQDGAGNLLYSQTQTLPIEVIPCQVDSFDLGFPLDTEY